MKDIKTIVKQKYGEIALQSDNQDAAGGCCGPAGDCCGVDYTIFSEDYQALEGYQADADLGLGCGIPTEFAGLQSGQQVLDLGSGAGNDCFVARAIVGPLGKVTGLDFSDQMIEKARGNARKAGFENVVFVAGDIEEMPLADEQFDVVISNCVLNLVPQKDRAFAGIMRVLKPGGHFCVSDVVVRGELPERLRKDAEMYAGCVAGASLIDDYIAMVEKAGFQDIVIHKERSIEVPQSILRSHLNENELQDFASGKVGIFSITMTASKVSSLRWE